MKNFGVLYNDDCSKAWLAPAYDIVCTVAYMQKDRPALTMHGKKIWFGKKELVKFGTNSCFLDKSEAVQIYSECQNALVQNIEKLEQYIKTDTNFKPIGDKMLTLWKLSLDEKSYKEAKSETL